jgi:hypothetical protein
MSTYNDALLLHWIDKLIIEATDTKDNTGKDREVKVSGELQHYQRALCLIEDQALFKGVLSEEKFLSVISLLSNMYARAILGRMIANKMEVVNKQQSSSSNKE